MEALSQTDWEHPRHRSLQTFDCHPSLPSLPPNNFEGPHQLGPNWIIMFMQTKLSLKCCHTYKDRALYWPPCQAESI